MKKLRFQVSASLYHIRCSALFCLIFSNLFGFPLICILNIGIAFNKSIGLKWTNQRIDDDPGIMDGLFNVAFIIIR